MNPTPGTPSPVVPDQQADPNVIPLNRATRRQLEREQTKRKLGGGDRIQEELSPEDAARQLATHLLRAAKVEGGGLPLVIPMQVTDRVTGEDWASGVVVAVQDTGLAAWLVDVLQQALIKLGQPDVWPPQPKWSAEIREAVERAKSSIILVQSGQSGRFA